MRKNRPRIMVTGKRWEVAQLVEQRFLVPSVAGSSPAFPAKICNRDLSKKSQKNVRGVAQPGSASVLGTEGREFESRRPDHHRIVRRQLHAVGH